MVSGAGAMEKVGIALDQFSWKGKKVLITGHSGFKGSWLCLALLRKGAIVSGISLEPEKNSLFSEIKLRNEVDSRYINIQNKQKLIDHMKEMEPEVVFHLAAQALVRQSYRDPWETYATNVMGTVNMLEGVKALESVRAVICVTTDKVYQNKGWAWPYRENDELGGYDPYSASKAASELIIDSYKQAFFSDRKTIISTARAGNVIGGGDWSEDRLIPDIYRAWCVGKTISIRNPDSVRPWQHVMEPIYSYIKLAEFMCEGKVGGQAFNFGPHPGDAITVGEIVSVANGFFGIHSDQDPNTDQNQLMHESAYLTLDTSKAQRMLHLKPRLSVSEALSWTFSWYKNFSSGSSARQLCEHDIRKYEALT